MKKQLLLIFMAVFLFTVAAIGQTTPVYPYTLTPITFTANVDKFSVNPIVPLAPIAVTLAPGITGNHAINVSVPPFTDINGNINSNMFSFSLNDGINNYSGHQALVYPGGTTNVVVNVDVSKLSATAIGAPLGVPVFIQDLQNGLTESVYINLNIVDGRTYIYPDSNTRSLPHLASGLGWRTTIQFTNQNSSNTQLRVDFSDQTGAPMATRLLDGRDMSSVYVDVPAHGTTNIVLQDSTVNYTIIGTARVIPTIGYPVGITEIIDTTNVPHSVGTPAQLINTDVLTFFYDATAGHATGLALTNSLNYAEPLTITYYDEFGNVLTTTTETLGPNAQIARTLDATTVPQIQGHTGVLQASLPAGFKTLNGIAFRFDQNFFFIPISPITNTIQ